MNRGGKSCRFTQATGKAGQVIVHVWEMGGST